MKNLAFVGLLILLNLSFSHSKEIRDDDYAYGICAGVLYVHTYPTKKLNKDPSISSTINGSFNSICVAIPNRQAQESETACVSWAKKVIQKIKEIAPLTEYQRFVFDLDSMGYKYQRAVQERYFSQYYEIFDTNDAEKNLNECSERLSWLEEVQANRFNSDELYGFTWSYMKGVEKSFVPYKKDVEFSPKDILIWTEEQNIKNNDHLMRGFYRPAGFDYESRTSFFHF